MPRGCCSCRSPAVVGLRCTFLREAFRIAASTTSIGARWPGMRHRAAITAEVRREGSGCLAPPPGPADRKRACPHSPCQAAGRCTAGGCQARRGRGVAFAAAPVKLPAAQTKIAQTEAKLGPGCWPCQRPATAPVSMRNSILDFDGAVANICNFVTLVPVMPVASITDANVQPSRPSLSECEAAVMPTTTVSFLNHQYRIAPALHRL